MTEIRFTPKSAKQARKLPRLLWERIYNKILTLGQDPIPADATKIRGYLHYYRIRIGNYRVIYKYEQRIEIITIIKIGHRKEIYKRIN